MLRQIGVEVASHKPTGQACREAGITEQTYYRWREEYGGLKLEQARRMNQLKKENARLRRPDAHFQAAHRAQWTERIVKKIDCQLG